MHSGGHDQASIPFRSVEVLFLHPALVHGTRFASTSTVGATAIGCDVGRTRDSLLRQITEKVAERIRAVKQDAESEAEPKILPRDGIVRSELLRISDRRSIWHLAVP